MSKRIRDESGRRPAPRTLLVVLSVLSALITSTVISAAPATASPGDLHCDGTEAQTYNPPLTLELKNRNVSATATLRCTSLTVPAIQSAQATLSGTGEVNCLTGGTTGKITFKYNDNIGSSLVQYSGGITVRPDGQTISTNTGRVVGGLFQGDTMSWTTVMATTDITKCFTTGVTTVAGLVTVTFV